MKAKTKLNIYRSMLLIRSIEEEIANRYDQGKMRCPTHLSIGQECVPSVLSEIINDDDFAVSTHRGHAHYLAKGGNPNSMIAEIYGKETGCAKGKGGSMHLIDLSVGFMGTSAIVGNSIPVGVGLAFSSYLRNDKNLSIVYLGDGAVEEGVFYESVNFAALKGLPVIFVCENNLYSVYSSLEVRQPHNRKIYKMVRALGIEANHIDGNDYKECYKVFKEIVTRARSGKPQFIECDTYRWREHCGPNYDNNIGYRTEEEFLKWKKNDPLVRIEKDISSQSSIKSVQEEVFKIVENAFSFAEMSDPPKQETAYQGVYSE